MFELRVERDNMEQIIRNMSTMNMTVDDIVHYGVPGMKWGVRKARVTKGRKPKKTKTPSKRSMRKQDRKWRAKASSTTPSELNKLAASKNVLRTSQKYHKAMSEGKISRMQLEAIVVDATVKEYNKTFGTQTSPGGGYRKQAQMYMSANGQSYLRVETVKNKIKHSTDLDGDNSETFERYFIFKNGKFVEYLSDTSGLKPYTGDGVIKHYGVPGMKWGVRKARPTKGRKPKKVKTVSSDSQIKRPKTKRGVAKLSNKELQTSITRMQLEQNYKRLNTNKTGVNKLATDIMTEMIKDGIKSGVKTTVKKTLKKKGK